MYLIRTSGKVDSSKPLHLRRKDTLLPGEFKEMERTERVYLHALQI